MNGKELEMLKALVKKAPCWDAVMLRMFGNQFKIDWISGEHGSSSASTLEEAISEQHAKAFGFSQNAKKKLR